MKPQLILSLALLAAGAIASAHDDTAAFAKFKGLAGTWKGTGREAGGDAMAMSVVYRVVSGGSAVEETIAPGTSHEMVTMYYLDGKRLTLTHYCALGNQPRMRLTPSSDAGTMKFAFDGGSNCASGSPCMESAAFQFVDGDHLKTRWGMVMGGKEMTHMEFDLQRAK